MWFRTWNQTLSSGLVPMQAACRQGWAALAEGLKQCPLTLVVDAQPHWASEVLNLVLVRELQLLIAGLMCFHADRPSAFCIPQLIMRASSGLSGK